MAGGFWGASAYDRDAKLHFGQGTYVAGGAVLAGIVGAIIGRTIGSAFDTVEWVDPPQDWVARYSGPGSISTPARGCPSLAETGQ